MLQFNFSDFPVISTSRLLLLKITLDDAETLHKIRNKEEVMQYIARPKSKNVDEAKTLIQQIMDGIDKNESISWAICEADYPERLIGTIGYYRTQFSNYRSEIGYLLDSDFWRKGYMTEAVRTIMNFGFHTLQFHSMEGCIDPNNEGSRAILTQAGFRKEAYYKENFFFEGHFLDTEVYGITIAEFEQLH